MPGHADALAVDDDDEVARVDVRRVLRLELAAQRVGDARREAAERLAVGVDDIPAPLDLAGLCAIGLGGHVKLFGPSDRSGKGARERAGASPVGQARARC